MNFPNYYAILPANVRYDENLSPNSKLLYSEITALTNMNGKCFASDDYFAKLYHVSKQSIQNWLRQLEILGYIKREIAYKKNSKEISSRHIEICIPYPKYFVYPTQKNLGTPTQKNLRDNINLSKDIINNTLTESNMYAKFYSDFYKLKKYEEFVYLTDEEVSKLKLKYGEEYTSLAIEKLNLWKLEKYAQKEYRVCKGDDHRKILKWVMMAVIEEQKKLNYAASQKVIANIQKARDPDLARKCNEMINAGYMKWEHAQKFSKENIEICYQEFVKNKQLGGNNND